MMCCLRCILCCGVLMCVFNSATARFITDVGSARRRRFSLSIENFIVVILFLGCFMLLC